jgi:hypothetical protein
MFEEKENSYDESEMVYTSCVNWAADWVQSYPPTLVDEWDLSTWVDEEMRDAIDTFITYGLHSARARNDALIILRAVLYEYYVFTQELISQPSRLTPHPEIVSRLSALPQTPQKSAAWHAEGRELLTAHEFGAVCYGTPSRYNIVLRKKCEPVHVVAPVEENSEEAAESQTVFMTDENGKLGALKWGWRYEPVARQLFETCVAGGEVHDTMGRVRHHTLPNLAASPDGLITSGPRTGRLVEIKCPITRELDNTIPLDYYCQMQLQAEVCDAEAVEYVEIRFTAAPAAQVKLEDCLKSKQPWIGKVCVVAAALETESQNYTYAYSPLFPTTLTGFNDCLAWRPSDDAILREESVWYVHDWHNRTVMRNTRWWATVGLPAYQEFWETVAIARTDGRFKPTAEFVSDSDSEPEPEQSQGWVGGDD